MLNLHFVLLLIITFLVVLAKGWITCPSSGIQVCSSSDSPWTIDSTTLIQNCIYQGCPPIDLVNGTLTVRNVTFYSNVQDGDNGGGAIRMVGDPSTGLDISNTKFINCSSSYYGEGGGAIFIYGPYDTQINITDTLFKNNFGTFLGGAIYGTTSFSIVFRRVSFIANTSRYGGAIFFDTEVNLGFYDCISSYNWAVRYGGFAYVSTTIDVDMNGHTSTHDQSKVFCGFFMSDTDTRISFNNLAVYDCASFNAAIFYSWGPATISFSNTLVQRSTIGENMEQAAHIFAQGRSAISLYNVTVLDSAYGDIVMGWNSPVTWDVGLVKNFTGITSVFKSFVGSPGTWAIVSNLVVRDSAFTKRGPFNFEDPSNIVSNVQAYNIALSQNAAIFKFNKGGFISNLDIHDIFLDDSSIFSVIQDLNMELGSNIRVRNIQMTGNSAIFYMEETGNINITSADLLVRNYSSIDGVADTAHLFLYSISDTGFFIGINDLISSHIDPGNLYILSPILAGTIMSTKYYHNYFPAGSKFVSPVPSALRIVNQNSFVNLQVLLKSTIPSILVKPVNYFGDDVAFQSLTNFVIIEMMEIMQNATLSGETIKAILDPNTNEVEFADLDIIGKKPGTYMLAAHGIYDTLVIVPGREYIWPNFSIVIKDCADTERFSPITSSCLPANSVSSQVRIALAVISLLVIVSLLVSLYSLYIYRNYNVVKANSHMFLSTMIIGSVISILSIVAQVQASPVSCMAAAWFENTGFVLSLASIIIKMFRLQKIFTKTLRTRKMTDLKDSYLMMHIARFIVLIWIYLGLWTGLQPSTLVTSLNVSMTAIYADICTTNEFNFVAITVRFLVTLLAAYYAYIIRHVPSNFNETKLIGFSCYNWVVFGTLLSLLVQGYVQDPSTGFIIQSISVIFPHLMSAYFLVFLRIYACRFNPDEVMKAPKENAATDSIPEASKFANAKAKITVNKENNDSLHKADN